MGSDEITNLHRRMDVQDTLLREIRDTIVGHIATDAELKPALLELVTLWKGSKLLGIILGACAAFFAGLWTLFVWAKEHIK